MEITFNRERFILSPLRALYWPRKKIVLLADMHLGKTGYFRARGIPIPSSVVTDDLERLARLIDLYEPDSVVVAGDMFHHDYNADISIFKQWRAGQSTTKFMLVPGNHDRLLDIDYHQLDFELTTPRYMLETIGIEHEPPQTAEGFSISGHLHPGFRMQGSARQAMRLPCFIINGRRMILPAFSRFTGLHTGLQTDRSCAHYVIAEQAIFKI